MNVEPGRRVCVEAKTFDVRKRDAMCYRRLLRKSKWFVAWKPLLSWYQVETTWAMYSHDLSDNKASAQRAR